MPLRGLLQEANTIVAFSAETAASQAQALLRFLCNLNLRALIAHVIDSLPTLCMRAPVFRIPDLCPGKTEGSASLAEDICSMRLGALILACLCWRIHHLSQLYIDVALSMAWDWLYLKRWPLCIDLSSFTARGTDVCRWAVRFCRLSLCQEA